MKKYFAIGLMSGTSLDGLDICFCSFTKDNQNWHYEILDTLTEKYPDELSAKLRNSTTMSGLDLALLNVDFGKFCGEKVSEFIKNHNISPDFIASHGHTVFHQPDKNMTLQIGDGATIAALTGVKTISNFRNCDVALGGQGAPLVPIGDKLMFSDYDLCLNLGGIANISTVNIDSTQINKGCDICFCNIALNFLAGKLGLDFDKNGQNAASGNVDNALLEKLNSQFIGKNKSLGIEIFEQNVKFLLNDENIVVEDKLRTMCEHISQILKNFISNIDTKKKDLSLLITGGGAKNTFLISLFKENLKNIKIVVPDQKIIDYKEALIFAFLGLLRLEEEANCLSSVTGASKNNIGGAIYLG